MYLDRRPLFLSKETRQAVLDVMNESFEKVATSDIDDQLHLSGTILPFLQDILTDAEVAERRRISGRGGWREPSMSSDDLMTCLREGKVPL